MTDLERTYMKGDKMLLEDRIFVSGLSRDYGYSSKNIVLSRIGKSSYDDKLGSSSVAENKKIVDALTQYYDGEYSKEGFDSLLETLAGEDMRFDNAVLVIGNSYNIRTALDGAVDSGLIDEGIIETISEKYRGLKLEKHVSRSLLFVDMYQYAGIIDEAEADRLKTAVLLHDVGKFGPDINNDYSMDIVKLFELDSSANDNFGRSLMYSLKKDHGLEEAKSRYDSIKEYLSPYFKHKNLDFDKMINKDFYRFHSYWSEVALNGIEVDEETKVIAENHHFKFIKKGMNDDIVLDNEETIMKGDVLDMIFMISVIDGYEAATSRSKYLYSDYKDVFIKFRRLSLDEGIDYLYDVVDNYGAMAYLYDNGYISKDSVKEKISSFDSYLKNHGSNKN